MRAEALEDRGVVRHGAEELQRLDARRHHPLERLGDLGLVGRLERRDAGVGCVECVIGGLLVCFGISKRYGTTSEIEAQAA